MRCSRPRRSRRRCAATSPPMPAPRIKIVLPLMASSLNWSLANRWSAAFRLPYVAVKQACTPTVIYGCCQNPVLTERLRASVGASENQDLVGFQRPLGEQVHAAQLDAVDRHVWPDPAGLGARASGGDFAALCKRPDHALDVVVTLVCLLTGDRALHAVADQEHAYPSFGALDQVERQPQRIVWALVAVRPIVDDDQIFPG